MGFFTWAELLSASNPQFVQGVTGQNLTDTITVTLPSAPTTGNTLLAAVSFQETVAGGATANLPTGFVQVGSTLNFDGSVSYNYLSIFTFTVPSSPASSYTFSYTSGTGATIGGIDVQLSEWSGVYASSPIDVFTTATGSSTTPSVPSVTTTRKNDTLITVSAFDGRSATTAITYTAPSGYTSFLGDSASTTAPIAAGNADIVFDTPGATTATTATLSATAPWGTFVIALASVAPTAVTIKMSFGGSSGSVLALSQSAFLKIAAGGSASVKTSLSEPFNIRASLGGQAGATVSVSSPMIVKPSFGGQSGSRLVLSEVFNLSMSTGGQGNMLMTLVDLAPSAMIVSLGGQGGMSLRLSQSADLSMSMGGSAGSKINISPELFVRMAMGGQSGAKADLSSVFAFILGAGGEGGMTLRLIDVSPTAIVLAFSGSGGMKMGLVFFSRPALPCNVGVLGPISNVGVLGPISNVGVLKC